jgi:hypothetical protein
VNGSTPDSGFVLKHGVAARVVYPDADAFNTFLFGLNDRGAIVGSWLNTAQTAQHGFFYNYEKNRFKLLDVPGHSFSEALAINNAGLVTITTEDNSYLYCPEKRTCPLHSEGAKDIPDRWISAVKLSRRVPCENGCIGSPQKITCAPEFDGGSRGDCARSGSRGRKAATVSAISPAAIRAHS